ncbi:GNAT family N-acetyltransferase [Ideonella oryzae]|uniref:GNAT family N-acetyltransferase n=1 Tax=Ideonella oryzae TaxID=2937441 RepID=A0ABT1BLQ3_9BURK|nr:GNAT family N-acetyltransferase [Ideonella oryzae]MCO5976769.1 GNAT family N-acetyltransferase [Ideonella oryzae]
MAPPDPAAPIDLPTWAALEAAAWAAWPALSEADHAGWRLRTAQGYTKRANSANADLSAQALAAHDLDAIEAHYAGQGLPAIFRLTEPGPQPALDATLAQRGYRRVDPSLVLWRPLGPADSGGPAPATRPWADWLAAFQSVSGKLGPGQATHLAMLQSITDACAPTVWPAHDPRSVGLAVRHQGWAGLFDVATAPDARRQGLARALCQQLLGWAAAQGAHHAYLQVVEANTAARTLYAQLGFVTAYRYWYRVKAS